jgi:hypothetical protein
LSHHDDPETAPCLVRTVLLPDFKRAIPGGTGEAQSAGLHPWYGIGFE